MPPRRIERPSGSWTSALDRSTTTRAAAVLSMRRILAPETAPAWVQDRAALWNAVEAAETRRNAQLARELVLTLPRELTPEQRLEDGALVRIG